MFAFLISLFGGLGVAVAAGGAGGSGSQQSANANAQPAPPPKEPDPVVPDTEDHDDHGDDMVGHDDDGDMGGQDDADHGDDMAGHDDHGDDMAGHDDHDGHGSVELPITAEEIAAFVAAVRASPEGHSHDMESSIANEHMAAMDLVPRDEATHIAIKNGDWNDPSSWHNGVVPGDSAAVLIPEGVHMTYNHVSTTEIFTIRVDGHLKFATDANSTLVVDTLVISSSGTLTIGTADNPVDPDVNVDIIFANNGPIDTDWDPMLLSRGMIAHGKTSIHGTIKDSHEKVIDDPMAGDKWVDFGTTPEGWAVGDTIVIAGTHYEGYYNLDPRYGYEASEDEERVITDIQDGMVFFDEPLEFNHDAPREDLKTSVANYTRNVSFETEDAETAEIYERAHVMFMHSDDVDVRYAEFHELGRTDKFDDAFNASEFENIAFDSNVKGRYSFHFHRTGLENQDEPAMAVGNAVYGSPGWGFVHHDSNAILENNATFNTNGAGYVAESGNETGAWNDNIAIFSMGNSWLQPKLANGPDAVENFDLGKSGDGFWFQGRMVESTNNIAASVNHGFVYFHRGPTGEDGNIPFDASVSDISDALLNSEYVLNDTHPILEFSGNEVFASNRGLAVVKGRPSQGHDVHSTLEDFTAWSVREGAFLEYTAHYSLIDFDIIGKEETDLSGQGTTGILFGPRTTDMAIVNPTISNFDTGIDLLKEGFYYDQHEFSVVNPTFEDVEQDYKNYDPNVDDLLSTEDLLTTTPDIKLDTPLYFKDANPYEVRGEGHIWISGTKTDSLGEVDFPAGQDNFTILRPNVIDMMEDAGYFTTSSGQNYFLMDLYFSDRLTGDIYAEKHPVLLDENVSVGSNGLYENVPFNGVVELETADDALSFDAAKLWATLTEGQVVLTDEGRAIDTGEDEEQLILEGA